MRERSFYVYILATRKDGPLHVGITNDLRRRIHEHKTHAIRGHTWRYNIDRLVYFEQFDTAETAILREKRIKRWRRAWKVELIEASNSDWVDLSDAFVA